MPLTALLAMTVVVTASNWLVQFPINDLLTWGALTYPFSFLITDLTTRLQGPERARQVVWAGFALAVALSIWLATPRIALASGTARTDLLPAPSRAGGRRSAAFTVVRGLWSVVCGLWSVVCGPWSRAEIANGRWQMGDGRTKSDFKMA